MSNEIVIGLTLLLGIAIGLILYPTYLAFVISRENKKTEKRKKKVEQSLRL